MNAATDPGLDALQELARHGTTTAHLAPPSTVRARADRRRRNRRVGGAAALTLAAVVLVPALGALGLDPGDQGAPVAPAGTGPSTGPTASDTGRDVPAVDIRTYADRWVVPDVEGGVASVASRERSPLPTGWRFEPRADDAVRIVTVATTDGASQCLTATEDGALGLQGCDDAVAGQAFTVTALDRPDQVNVRTVAGLLAATPGHGLRPDGGPESPSTVFTLD